MPVVDDGSLLYLDSTAVVELCRAIDPVAVVTEALLAVQAGSSGVAAEAALRWTAPDGTAARSLVLPARHGDSVGCKIINGCIGNPARGLERAHGLVVLFDYGTAAPVCVLEAGHISALRTASVSVAALRAVRDLTGVRRVAFLGCGRQARTHLELLASYHEPAEVMAYDTSAARAGTFVEAARGLLPGASVKAVDGPEAAMREADVTVAVTTTTTPYVPLGWLRPGASFLNVSLDDASEELLLGCDHLVVDDWTLVSEDDSRLLGRLARDGLVTAPDQAPPPGGRRIDADLPTLLSGGYDRPVEPADRVVINPFGMGVHDVAVATRVYREALHRGMGRWLPR